MPSYLPKCILHDGWSTYLSPRDFTYFTWEEKSANCWGLMAENSKHEATPLNPKDERCQPHREYILASAGKDGKYERRDFREYKARGTCSYNNDIILRDGEFIQIPVGVQDDSPASNAPCGPGGTK